MQPPFRDRREAGRLLAEPVSLSVRGDDVLVLGLSPGGVPVAYEIARSLRAPLDVFVVRKLEASGRDEPTVGVIAAGGVRVLDSATIAGLDGAHGALEDAARREAVKLARLERYYRGHRQAPRMSGRAIVLADDGLSGPTMTRAAVDALFAYRPARIIVALPVALSGVPAEVQKRGASVVFARAARETRAAAGIYEDDAPVSDREVRHLLSRAGLHEDHHQLTG